MAPTNFSVINQTVPVTEYPNRRNPTVECRDQCTDPEIPDPILMYAYLLMYAH